MLVQCEQCRAKYKITIKSQPGKPVTFRCGKCKNLIQISPDQIARQTDALDPPAPTPKTTAPAAPVKAAAPAKADTVKVNCLKCGNSFIKPGDEKSPICYQCRIDSLVGKIKEKYGVKAPAPAPEDVTRYTIRSADGLVLGPIRFRSVSVLAREKRLKGAEEVSKDGAEYKPLMSYPELAELFPELKEMLDTTGLEDKVDEAFMAAFGDEKEEAAAPETRETAEPPSPEPPAPEPEAAPPEVPPSPPEAVAPEEAPPSAEAAAPEEPPPPAEAAAPEEAPAPPAEAPAAETPSLPEEAILSEPPAAPSASTLLDSVIEDGAEAPAEPVAAPEPETAPPLSPEPAEAVAPEPPAAAAGPLEETAPEPEPPAAEPTAPAAPSPGPEAKTAPVMEVDSSFSLDEQPESPVEKKAGPVPSPPPEPTAPTKAPAKAEPPKTPAAPVEPKPKPPPAPPPAKPAPPPAAAKPVVPPEEVGTEFDLGAADEEEEVIEDLEPLPEPPADARYRIRYPDGLMLGPVKLATIKELFSSGNLTGQEEVQREGEPWVGFAELVELADLVTAADVIHDDEIVELTDILEESG